MGFGRCAAARCSSSAVGLNALTGIDGIWTRCKDAVQGQGWSVLMPLRALMGFGHRSREMGDLGQWFVLMPLRALMGFGQIEAPPGPQGPIGLNALTGIDGIWTLSTIALGGWSGLSLNALTGIDGIWTPRSALRCIALLKVLMPLRALMGFGPTSTQPA